MSHDNSHQPTNYWRLTTAGLLLIMAAAAVVTRGAWWPVTPSTVNSGLAPEEDVPDTHEGHNDSTSIELSENGLKNIGYEPFEVPFLPLEWSFLDIKKANSSPCWQLRRGSQTET